MFKRLVILCSMLVTTPCTSALAQNPATWQEAQATLKKAKEAEARREKLRAENAAKKSKAIPDDAEKTTRRYLGWKPLATGDVGRLWYPFRVIQVVDDDNAIVEIQYEPYVAYARSVKETVWIKMSTKDMADDKKYSTNEYFKVTGTKKYDTAVGATKTVMMLEPTDNPEEKEAAEAKEKAASVAQKKAAERAEAEQKLKAEKEKRAKEDTRTWTVGEEKYAAQFISRIANKVILKKQDGTAVKVTLEELSDADREWVANRSRK